MNLNQKQRDALLNIFWYEQTHDPKDYTLGWSWSDVRVTPATLNNLVLKGLIEEKFHSNSYRGLLLTELGREQANLMQEPAEAYEKPMGEPLTLSDDIFEDIIGHDEVKELLMAALLAGKACARITGRTTGTRQILVSVGYRTGVQRASDMACGLGNKQGGAVGPGSRT